MFIGLVSHIDNVISHMHPVANRFSLFSLLFSGLDTFVTCVVYSNVSRIYASWEPLIGMLSDCKKKPISLPQMPFFHITSA